MKSCAESDRHRSSITSHQVFQRLRPAHLISNGSEIRSVKVYPPRQELEALP